MNKLLTSIVLLGMVLAFPAALAQEDTSAVASDEAAPADQGADMGGLSGMATATPATPASAGNAAIPAKPATPAKQSALKDKLPAANVKAPAFGLRREPGISMTSGILKETNGQPIKMAKRIGSFGKEVSASRASGLSGNEGGKVVQGRERKDRGSPFSTGKNQKVGTNRWAGVQKR